jgi:hypothetical protein
VDKTLEVNPRIKNNMLAAKFRPVPDALFRPFNDFGVSGNKKTFKSLHSHHRKSHAAETEYKKKRMVEDLMTHFAVASSQSTRIKASASVIAGAKSAQSPFDMWSGVSEPGSKLTFALVKINVEPPVSPARRDVCFAKDVLLHPPQLNLSRAHSASPVLLLNLQSDEGGPDGHVLHWASKGSGLQADAFGVFVVENAEGVDGVGKV